MLGQRVMATTLYQRLPGLLRGSLQTVCSAAYVIVLISVNLIGYSVGAGGITGVLGKFATYEGMKVIGISFYFLCWGVRLMSFLKEIGCTHEKAISTKQN